MPIHQIIGMILIVIGIAFATFGIFGIYYYKNFYTRAAIASLIDSTGFLFIAIGVMFYQGLSSFTFKTGFLIVLVLLLNPLANHYIVRGAHSSGHRPGKER